MKFTDGNWLMLPGVRPAWPAQAYEVETEPGSLTIHAPTHPIRHRGDTLQGPMLSVRLSSPLADVLRVRAEHFRGGRRPGPYFQVPPDTRTHVSVLSEAEFVGLVSGRLMVKVPLETDFRLDFVAEGQALTSSGNRDLGYMQVDGEGAFMKEALSLGVGELVYGLGERFSAFAKNGQSLDMWNRDGGTGSEQAYKNVPFYLTNRGYGVFVNDPGRVSYEVASERVSRVQFSVLGEALEYLVVYGPSPAEILEKYTALTGRPALPPAWSFGLWLTTSFTTPYDEETISSFVDGMAERGIPLHVFHFDCFWMREFHWCDFLWDTRAFPDPAGMLSRLKERGLRISLWINPYIAQRSALFDDAAERGYLLRRPDGSVWQGDLWQPGLAIVDFTNPDARSWYAEKLEALLDMGVDTFKTDFGERIPTDVVYHDGSDPERMHNYYSSLYNETVFNLLERRKGDGQAVVFARSATAGSQRFPVHWGGDCDSTYPSMAESLRGGLSLALSGFGFWSHDIGGFEGLPPADLFKRWIAFGLLSSHSRLHGSSSYRVPWLFDEEAVDVLRFYTKLKCRLMPYLYQLAVVAARSGVPVMRPMVLAFPDDPACAYLDRQYMLGDRLLVAPVFDETGKAEYYLPPGTWADLLTGRIAHGGRWMRERRDYFSTPVWVRCPAVIPLGAIDERPDYDFREEVSLQVFGFQEGDTVVCEVPDASGERATRFAVTAGDGRLTGRREGAALPWSLRLVEPTTGREGLSAAAEELRGKRVDASAGTDVLRIEMS